MAAVERRGARGSNRGTRLSFAIWPRKSLDSSSRVNFTCSGPQARSVLAPRPSTCTPRTPSPAPPRGAAATVYMVHARSSHRGVGGWGKGPFEPGGSTAVSCFSRKGFAVMGHRTVVSGFLSVVRAWRGGGGRVRRGGPQVLAGGRAGEQVDVWGWVRVGGVGVGGAGAGGGRLLLRRIACACARGGKQACGVSCGTQKLVSGACVPVSDERSERPGCVKPVSVSLLRRASCFEAALSCAGPVCWRARACEAPSRGGAP